MPTSDDSQDAPPRQEPPQRPLEQVLEGVEAQYHEWEAQVREANERIDKAAGRPLWAAIAVGVGLGAVFLTTLLLSPELFALFVAALIVLAVVELVQALRHGGARLSPWALAPLALAILVAAYIWGALGILIALAATVLVAVLGRLALAISPGSRDSLWWDIAGSAFVLVYIGVLGASVVVLGQQERGQWWVLGAIIVVVTVDVSAYAVGRALGRHKLAPTISPGKTWEGFAGAALAAAVAGGLVGVFLLDVSLVWGLLIGVVLLLTATGGDLFESWIKRALGIKDMSSLLPGHGGVLDRLDSALPSVAVTLLLYHLLA